MVKIIIKGKWLLGPFQGKKIKDNKLTFEYLGKSECFIKTVKHLYITISHRKIFLKSQIKVYWCICVFLLYHWWTMSQFLVGIILTNVFYYQFIFKFVEATSFFFGIQLIKKHIHVRLWKDMQDMTPCAANLQAHDTL